MKKKAIERIPYIGLKKNIRPKSVKYIGITAIRIVGHEKQQLFYYMDIVNKRIAELPEEEKTVQVNKKNKKNYMKEVLELYGRKDK